MTKIVRLREALEREFKGFLDNVNVAFDEITVDCHAHHVHQFLAQLKNYEEFAFDQLIDLCAIDYLDYGIYDWETMSATESGFSRGVERYESRACTWPKPRFAVVYHLLSTVHNYRIRVKVFLEEHQLVIPSVHDIWKAANWFEREAYDLFGILFENHPDLRRLLTDYGFIGHPFRKDFPISGHVEMRYDAQTAKVIYAPVSIEPRILVPKVIRDDNRYIDMPGVSHHD